MALVGTKVWADAEIRVQERANIGIVITLSLVKTLLAIWQMQGLAIWLGR